MRKVKVRPNSIRKLEAAVSSKLHGVSQERKLSREISWHFSLEPKVIQRHRRPYDSPNMRSEGRQKSFFTYTSFKWMVCSPFFLTKLLLIFERFVLKSRALSSI